MNPEDFATDAGFEAARAQLDEAVRQARENETRAAALAHDVDSLTGTAHSRGHEVTVVARPGGRLVSIEFGPAADRIDRGALARLTMQTTAAAQHAAMSALADRGAELFGDESDIARSLRSDADGGYPAPVDEQ